MPDSIWRVRKPAVLSRKPPNSALQGTVTIGLRPPVPAPERERLAIFRAHCTMIVILDTNIWLAELGLRSPLGAIARL